LGVENVPADQTKSYGIVATTPLNKNIEQVSAIVEKPDPKDAPSTLAVVGRYILSPRIFYHLDSVQAGAGGEIQLTDGISALLTEEQVLAYRFDGVRYDCGSKFGYLEATIRLGLKHPEVSKDLRALLESIVNDKKIAS
jgi:UTP--glucose-1-phosphate uridylyltransferase